MFYTIGETAKMMGVAPSTLRYYDKEGLLPFVERSQSGLRMFKNSDIEWLKIIECLKKTGMSIKDIKQFVLCAIDGDSTIDERLDILTCHRDNVKRQLNEIIEHLDLIEYKIWYYTTAKEAGTCAIIPTIPASSVPEKLRKFHKTEM